MSADHSQAPVLEALARYHAPGRLPFSPPGHKQARGADPRVREVLGDVVFYGDVLASGGLDDRRTRNKVLERAEKLMADAVHASHTFFSTCGSSLSVKAAMLSVACPHEELLIGRDAHKSVVSGLILAGIRPVWVDPRWDAERHLAHPPSAEDFERAFAAHPDAKGALVTSPTPYGSCADLRSLADVCHRRGRPLIVDEAWGAHLPFHPDLPAWAMDAGADVCVTSIHKMGSGLEQGSVFHLQGDLIDPALLKTRADLLGTTSPSVLIYAGLDGWRRQMAQHGRDLMDRALSLAARTRAAIERIEGLHVHDRADFCGPGLADDFDPLPVVIDVSGLGTTGYQVADWLREHRRVDVHLADHRRINTQLTHADDQETAEVLLEALRAVATAAAQLPPAPTVDVPAPRALRLEQRCLPRDAFFGRVEDVPVERAAGRHGQGPGGGPGVTTCGEVWRGVAPAGAAVSRRGGDADGSVGPQPGGTSVSGTGGAGGVLVAVALRRVWPAPWAGDAPCDPGSRRDQAPEEGEGAAGQRGQERLAPGRAAGRRVRREGDAGHGPEGSRAPAQRGPRRRGQHGRRPSEPLIRRRARRIGRRRAPAAPPGGHIATLTA